VATADCQSKVVRRPIIRNFNLERPISPALSAQVIFCLVLVLTFFVYLPGLSGPLVLDDYPQLDPILESAGTASWHSGAVSKSGILGRPVAMLSFIANAAASGANFWWWKFTNLAIHLLCGVLVFALTARILSVRAAGQRGDQYFWALLVAALWLLHPLQVSTVLYTVQRMTQLSTLFILSGLLAYFLGRERQLAGQSHGWAWIVLAFAICFPLAAFSKETGLLFPVYTLLLEALFFGFKGNHAVRRFLGAFYVVGLVLPAVAGTAFLLADFDQLVRHGYDVRSFTLYERVITQFRVLIYYLYEILLPHQGNLGFLHDDFAVSTGLWSPPGTIVSLLALLGLLCLGWALRAANSVAAFGIFFFFAAHLLESTFFPLELMFEHRNYLAIYGIILTLCSLARFFVPRIVTLTLAVVAIAALGSVVIAYVDLWSSHQKMFSQMALIHPDSPRLRITLASDYAEAGKYDLARAVLSDLAGAGFDLQRAYIDCRQHGQLAATQLKQITFYKESKITTYEVQGLEELANLGLDGQCRFSADEYLRILDEALSARVIDNRSVQSLLMYKAHYLHKTGQFEAALAALDAAFRAYDANAAPLFLATEWLIQAKDKVRAEKYLAKAQMMAEKNHQDVSPVIGRIRANMRDL